MHNNTLRQIALPGLLVIGDLFFALVALSLAWWLRYETALGQFGIPAEAAHFTEYIPLLLVGGALLIGTYAQLGLYDERLLLRRYQSMAVIIKGTVFWLLAYLGVSLALKFQPPISRVFVVVAFFTIVLTEHAWRLAFSFGISRGALLERIQQRVAVLGWNADALRLVREITDQRTHPYQIVGLVSEHPGDTPDPRERLPALVLGPLDDLTAILRAHRIDILITAHLDFPGDRMQAIIRACEQNYVELKAIPSVFQVFVSGLRMQPVGNVPVLGIESLAVAKLFNRLLKRGCDLAGASLGLLLSAPVIAILAWLIRRESPGPVFFGQERIGAGHRPFTMWKLRSMRPGSASAGHLRQGFTGADPRLRIGRFMRQWNLDELPQFWNVLRGEMSLVGPRPELPCHVERLATEIPHYLPRHVVKPGMTGWAQIKGLRGPGDFSLRIQHDIYYIENWSFWLDLQILLLTFSRWRSPSE